VWSGGGGGRGRKKARVVEETLAPGAKVSEVARRHGISASLVFTWRRQARASQEMAAVVPRFAAVRIADRQPEAAISTTSEQLPAGGGRNGLMEIRLGGATPRAMTSPPSTSRDRGGFA
jgi:transposase